MIFSPAPILSYQAHTHQVPAVFAGMADPDPCWNLYWLVAPWVDDVLTTGKIGAGPVQHVSTAVIGDIRYNPDLADACRNSPEHFLDWVTTYPYLHCLAVHELLGSDWIQTAIARAEEASARLYTNKSEAVAQCLSKMMLQ